MTESNLLLISSWTIKQTLWLRLASKQRRGHLFCLLVQQTVIESQEQSGRKRVRFCFWIGVLPRTATRCPVLCAHTRVWSETLVSRRLSFVNEFGAQGKVSLASQYDSLLTSGPPRPGAQSWAKVNVGHADMYLWHAMTQHAVNVILMCSLSVSMANTVEILACLKAGERHDKS